MLKQLAILIAASTLMACGEEATQVTEAPATTETIEVIAESAAVEVAQATETAEVAVETAEAATQTVEVTAEPAEAATEAVATGTVAE